MSNPYMVPFKDQISATYRGQNQSQFEEAWRGSGTVDIYNIIAAAVTI
jgi:hypothetical protein